MEPKAYMAVIQCDDGTSLEVRLPDLIQAQLFVENNSCEQYGYCFALENVSEEWQWFGRRGWIQSEQGELVNKPSRVVASGAKYSFRA